MAKTWEQMTQAEKIEDLRSDVKNLIATVNAWTEQTRQLGAFHNVLSKKVSEVSEALQSLAGHAK